jgi:23S rRNA (uridine2552-2'-O)-methyltransferase
MKFKVKDHYFLKAKKEDFLARSVYKLEEINQKFKILHKGQRVLDLGYHPGSWIQYTEKVIGPEGTIVGIDVRDINKKLLTNPQIKLYQLDIEKLQSLADFGESFPFDVVLSDMAPNTSGIKNLDQIRSVGLIEMVLSKLDLFLKRDGVFCFKIFDSNEAQALVRSLNLYFNKVEKLKPKSTRSISKEFFVICFNYNLKKYEGP